MALMKCKECGNDVSNTAASCPKCGAKVPKKTGIGTLVVAGLIGWAVFSFISSGGSIGTSSSSTHSITYHVDGSTSKASLTYQNAQGGSQQEDASVPWRKTISAKSGDFLYISAQNKESYGDIRVRILVDGKKFRNSEASGGFTIASANGSCCQ